MANNPNQNRNKAAVQSDPYPFDRLSRLCALLLLFFTVFCYPLMMDSTKYSQITRFKGNTFTVIFIICTVGLLFLTLLSETTRVTRRKPASWRTVSAAPFWADIALLAYWVFMFISSVCAKDSATAFMGIQPRNNGFFYQTMYVGSYFFLSYMLRSPAPVRCRWTSGRRGLVSDGWFFSREVQFFVLGGVLLAVACILHFYGVDLYDIASVNGATYGGPFWVDSKYRFLGPVGNVNLGSYILSAAAVITAGLYINKFVSRYDRHGLITLGLFAVILYAELNINTDAGVVALAVAAVLLPAVLCTGLGHLNRLLHIYCVSACLVLFNHCLVDVVLRGEEFGGMGVLLVLAAAGLTTLCGAGLTRWLSSRCECVIAVKGYKNQMRRSGKKQKKNRALTAPKGTSAKSWRKALAHRRLTVMLAGGIGTGLLVSLGLLAVSLWMTSAKGNPLGESTPIHALGNMLRGADCFKGIVLLLAVCALVASAIMLWSPVRISIKGKTLQRLCIAAAALVVVCGLALSLIITAPDPTPAGTLAGAAKVTDKADLKEKSDNMVHELGQMLRGNFDDSFGHNRLFTWKRTLRLCKLNPMFGIGPDNYKQFFASYFHDEAVKMFPSSNGGLDKAHNEFLDVLICNGIVGLIAYLTFFGLLLFYAFRGNSRGRLAPIFGIAVAAYMAHAFFGYQLPIQSPVMWMMIGTLAAFLRSESRQRVDASEVR
ncbi:MAG: O-antigen ligase family protein [Ruminococcaceae bacterium]|nr:O-antigen ligase family protein [Oscillospiraceae bacterium]